MYFFIPRDVDRDLEYRAGVPLTEIFREIVTGMVTAHDDLVIDFGDERLKDIAHRLRDQAMSDSRLRNDLSIKDNAGWKLPEARKRLRAMPGVDTYYIDIDYRPFDTRRINYNPALVWSDRRRVMRHLTTGENIALSVVRQLSALPWCHVFIGRNVVESAFVSNRSREICHVMPLWIGAEPQFGLDSTDRDRVSNVRRDWVPRSDQIVFESDQQVLAYVYALLHSPTYRHRYEESLQKEIPRVFLTASASLVSELSELGGQLLGLHLLESPKLDDFITTYAGPRTPVVSRVGWSDGAVWLDTLETKKGKAVTPGTVGFVGVPEAVWNFHISAYQVCEKWLKDRKGRMLSDDDIVHYQKIVVALSETIRLMKEVDEAIEAHGGWPGAFQTGKEQRPAPSP